MQTCEQTWDQIEKRDWEGWKGLPADCLWADATARFTPKYEGTIGFHMGTARTAAAHQELLVEGFARPLRAWERGTKVVLVEVDATEKDQDLPARLGEPGGTMDYYFMTTKLEGGALVYPDRGLALLSNEERSSVTKIFLFTPTSLDSYGDSLHHPVEPARRMRR